MTKRMKMLLIFNLIFDFILPISGGVQIICQHDYGTISCDVHYVIAIVNSVYGRLDETTCAIGYTLPGDQCTIDSTAWLRQKCQDRQSCILRPADIITDPCPNKIKYITATYACIDTDDCATNPCQNGGICNDGLNSYTCSCAAGYAGGNCQTNIDECATNHCLNGGICNDGIHSYTCTCASGYEGFNCQTNIDDCISNPCQNGGSCTDEVNGYSCSCYVGYKGTVCEQRDGLFFVHYVQQGHIQSHELVLTHVVRSRIHCARICSLNYVCYGFVYSSIAATCQTFSRTTVSSNTMTYYV